MLYKVCKPGEGNIFYPKKFWRSADWSRSSTNPKPGLIETEVLYAGDQDEIIVHLLPEIRRVAVTLNVENRLKLENAKVSHSADKRSIVFCERDKKGLIDVFSPTVFIFSEKGFVHVQSGEYVSYSPQTAIEKIEFSMSEAQERFNFEICYISSLDNIIKLLRENQVSYTEQD
jgi:hypothetical protein